MVYKDNNRIII